MRNLIRFGMAAIALYGATSLGCVSYEEYDRLQNRVSALESQNHIYGTRIQILEIESEARDQAENEMIEKGMNDSFDRLANSVLSQAESLNEKIKIIREAMKKEKNEDKKEK